MYLIWPLITAAIAYGGWWLATREKAAEYAAVYFIVYFALLAVASLLGVFSTFGEDDRQCLK